MDQCHRRCGPVVAQHKNQRQWNLWRNSRSRLKFLLPGLRLRLRFESMGSRGRCCSAASALTQIDVHRAVAAVPHLPSLKCSSHWSLGLYPASVEFLQPGWQSLLHLLAGTLCAALSAFPHTLCHALYEYELQQHAAQRKLPVLSGCSLQTRDAQLSL
jgi:hypothetical protein